MSAPPLAGLGVPVLDDEPDMLSAALAYIAAGWYVLPVKRGSKSPGSVVGEKWHAQSSRDPKQLTAWFAGTTHGIALHCGRSGAVVFDVDAPDKLPDALRNHLDSAPFQSTRTDVPGRGHYIFTQPAGRLIGNGTGRLGGAWGEVRGLNGVIIAAPSHHPDGGRYQWVSDGLAPPLPEELAVLLDDASPAVDAAADSVVRAFIAEHQTCTRPTMLQGLVSALGKRFANGESRHQATITALTGALKEARAGYYSAREAIDAIWPMFLKAATAQPISDKQGLARSPERAKSEFAEILAWAVGQALAADIEDIHARVAEKMPSNVEWVDSIDEIATVDPAQVHRGQARMAYRLAERYPGQLLHVAGLGWHRWDSTRWTLDQQGRAKRAVLAELRSALAESLDDKELRADVRKCESAAGVSGVLDIAAALEPFAASIADLDADAHLLNVANGTLDLHTLDLRPHTAADRITKLCRGAYDPDAEAPVWTGFLARVLPDEDVREFLQRLVGVALLGAVREHVLGILTGVGANGKSVWDKAIRYSLGDYSCTAEPGLFMHREGGHPTGEMDLRGVRLAVVSESDKDRRLAEATVKRLTGGDAIRARRMRQDFVEFTPSHTALLVTNHLPKVSGDDAAVWRRLRVVPFDVVIPADEQDRELDARLQLEADGILSWAVAGYRAYLKRGLDEPLSVREATDTYHHNSDAVARFITEVCVTTTPGLKATTGQLHDAWDKWRVDDGAEPMSQKSFGQALDRHGYPAGPVSNSKRWRTGIALKVVEE